MDRVNIRTPSLHIVRLALHEHLPESDSVEQHAHTFSQALLYLHGEGWQSFSGNRARVEPGTLVVIPPGIPHSFERRGAKFPQCLVIDFRFRQPGRRRPMVSILTRSELAQVQQCIAHLSHLQRDSETVLHTVGAALAIQLVVTLLRSAAWLPREAPHSPGNSGKAISDLLQGMDPSSDLSDVIRKSGYQRDHLNALVKRETGLTLGQYRSQQRLLIAKRLLTARQLVAAVAAAIGMNDQSYFSRWFRRQTGQQPRSWGGAWS
jgi:AraC family L-rhamnose operon transcriptional activator RhaR